MMKKFLLFLLTIFIAVQVIAYGEENTKIYEDQNFVVLKTESNLYIMRKWKLGWYIFPFSTEINSFLREKDTDESGSNFLINGKSVYFSEFKYLLYYNASKTVIQGRQIRDFDLKVTDGGKDAKESWSVLDGVKSVIRYNNVSENLTYAFTLNQ